MDLTARITETAARGLSRLPPIRAARTGPTRSTAERLVWHDTADLDLARRGLMLSHHHHLWHLERHWHPGPRPDESGLWYPGLDHRVLASGPDQAALVPGLGETAAVAGFEGRRTIVPLLIGGAPVTLTLLRGTIRANGAARAEARLTLSGAPAAVIALLRDLTAHVPLSVPTRSLAMEALAVQPPRTGTPVLPESGISTRAAFAHIVGYLTAVMIDLSPSVADTASGPAPVHQMRVAVRRARSALTVFRPVIDGPAFEASADGLRALGRMLAPARDWDVFMTETLPPVEDAFPGQPDLARLRTAGTKRRAAARAALAAWLEGPDFHALCLDLACLAADVAADQDEDTAPPLADFAASVLAARWRRLRRSGRSLDSLDHPAMHMVRLKTKRLRYAAEFFAPLFPDAPVHGFLRRLARTQERLGLYNDTATADALMRDLSARPGHASGLVLGFTGARAAGIRPKILSSWKRLRRREPFWA